MSISDRKKEENKALKAKIMSAAVRVLAEQGYARLSMRKIASLIDYSPTTIYRFFRNKEDLLVHLAMQVFADLSAEVEKVKAAHPNDPLVLLKSLLAAYAAFCLDRPDMFRLFNEISSFEMEEGILYETLGTVRRPVYQSWREAIQQSIDAGKIETKDETRVFLFLWDSLHGYIEHRVKYPRLRRKPLEKDTEEFLELVFQGIEADKASR